MASSTLEQVERGARVFIDASVFIYHFTGASLDCRRFLETCERGQVLAIFGPQGERMHVRS